MSTFNGIVKEFPRIRIDFFRIDPLQPPPLACFLSHVHSDHLQGLESLKSPFVYCSAATRQLLLRMERYPHRMNFMSGVLEKRKQHFRHLRLVLKAIPLHCPTEIELGPLEKIRVSLFDANHCPGSVMFLIEGNHKAILYTGDMRSEPWWINSLIRNPILLPYTTRLKRLNQIYLDTTFARHDDVYQTFPSKAEGVHELLEKLAQYPPETVFYFNAWTFGYEEVWIAMSSFLRSRVHVDSYQLSLYKSMSLGDAETQVCDHSSLNGFHVGNHYQPGCLTSQSNVRLHSCEPGTPCHAALLDSKQVVWVTPIIARARDGPIIPELGAGGGDGDLYQGPELELPHDGILQQLEESSKRLNIDTAQMARLTTIFRTAMKSRKAKLSLDRLDLDLNQEFSLREFLSRLLAADQCQPSTMWHSDLHGTSMATKPFSASIHFPFSRHSSYSELCHFVSVFRPVDIFPCTVDEDKWTEDLSIQALFGSLCSGSVFAHDEAMRVCLDRRQVDEALPSKRQKMAVDEMSQATALSHIPIQFRASVTETYQAPDWPDLGPSSPQFMGAGPTDNAKTGTVRKSGPMSNLIAIKTVYEDYRARPITDRHASYTYKDRDYPDEGKRGRSTTSPTLVQGPERRRGSSDSALGSQPRLLQSTKLEIDGTSGEEPPGASQPDNPSTSGVPPDHQIRRDIRLEAYRAAKRTLETSDSGVWDDLGIKSLGGQGHSQPENEL